MVRINKVVSDKRNKIVLCFFICSKLIVLSNGQKNIPRFLEGLFFIWVVEQNELFVLSKYIMRR